MNIPTAAGERYLCFVIEREDRGWGGPYGQHRRPLIWRCVECGHTISDHTDTFTTIDWDDVEPVDIMDGGSPCFVAGTPVLTHRGLIPIEDVIEGDQVWTHEARWRPVTATMTRIALTDMQRFVPADSIELDERRIREAEGQAVGRGDQDALDFGASA